MSVRSAKVGQRSRLDTNRTPGYMWIMGERERRQRINGEDTGRCGCGRRGPSGTGECSYCREDFDGSREDENRRSSEVRDVTEEYKNKHGSDLAR